MTKASLLLRPSPGLSSPRRFFLDGDLRDEVAHLPNRRLGFFLGGGLDHVLDLFAGGSIASNWNVGIVVSFSKSLEGENRFDGSSVAAWASRMGWLLVKRSPAASGDFFVRLRESFRGSLRRAS
jgi:hypothetical protein